MLHLYFSSKYWLNAYQVLKCAILREALSGLTDQFKELLLLGKPCSSHWSSYHYGSYRIKKYIYAAKVNIHKSIGNV